jgi:hypothetical protein
VFGEQLLALGVDSVNGDTVRVKEAEDVGLELYEYLGNVLCGVDAVDYVLELFVELDLLLELLNIEPTGSEEIKGSAENHRPDRAFSPMPGRYHSLGLSGIFSSGFSSSGGSFSVSPPFMIFKVLFLSF